MFEKIRLKNITIKNHFIRSATSERVSINGVPDVEKLSSIYRKLARGGVSIIITGYTFVSTEGQSSLTQNGLHSDNLVPVWEKIINLSKVKEHNVKIFVQLMHSGRQVFYEREEPVYVLGKTKIPIVKNKVHILTKKDIRKIRKDFINATLRAIKSGFDGVQLHCAHGYLLNQFLSGYTNKRSDEYGGNIKNRTRFLKEILSDIREKNSSFPISIKINACDFLSGGLVPEETAEIIELVKEYNIEFWEISGWMWEAQSEFSPSRQKNPLIIDEEGYFKKETYYIKRVHTDEFVVLCGGVRSKEFCKEALKSVDLISFSRPLICEPDLIKKMMSNDNYRAKCSSCNECLAKAKNGIKCVRLCSE